MILFGSLPPATGTVKKSPFVLSASSLSVFAVKHKLLAVGRKRDRLRFAQVERRHVVVRSGRKVARAPPPAGITKRWLRLPSHQPFQCR